MDIRVRRSAGRSAVRCPAAFRQPGFYFGEIPDDAAGRESKTARKFSTLLHFIDRRIGERHDLAQFIPADCSFDGLLSLGAHGFSSVGKRLVPMETDSHW
jgi:hypothetical protein